MSRVQRPGFFRRAAWGARTAWSVLTGAGTALPPWDDYWYSRPGWDSAAGMAVTPETAMRLSAVFGCVRVRSETTASLPLIIYKRLPDGGKRRAPEHPLFRLLHDVPNQWQTALEFVEMMQAHLDLRGNAFAHILPGARGAIDQLVPLHPDLVQVFRLPDGRLKYQVRSRFSSEIDWYAQDDIFHLRGLSSDGLVGLSPIAVQRETVGSGLGMQDHGARWFANGSMPSGVLEFPGKFKDDAARDKFRESWQKSQNAENKHKVAVLEQGMKYSALGVSNKDSQFLEAKQATANEICGIYRVPPHKIGILERSTNNNIEHQEIEFVTSCIRPIAVRWERRINLDLIDPVNEAIGAEEGEYFAEFLIDGLLRGDLKSRYDAYSVGRNGGWLCPNDIANLENMNPIPPEKGGNDYLRPSNTTVAGAAAPVTPELQGAQPDNPPAEPGKVPADEPRDEGLDSNEEDEEARKRESILRSLASEAAGRIVRREVAAVRKTIARMGDNFDDSLFRAQAKEFYDTHAHLVSQAMCISQSAAAGYVRGNLNLLCGVSGMATEKLCALDWIEDTAPEALASLALGVRGKKERCAR